MNIREFSHNLQKLYGEMSTAFSEFQRDSNLPCLPGCGSCCLNPEIEATTLEMIPMALRILDAGQLEEWHERLLEPRQEHCLMAVGQLCGSYEERPAVCRMFGVAGYFNKEHGPALSICKYIKEEYPEQAMKVSASPSPDTPMMSHWTSRLAALDPGLLEERQSINKALRAALEKVGLWSHYSN